jgi:hypothetical protein
MKKFITLALIFSSIFSEYSFAEGKPVNPINTPALERIQQKENFDKVNEALKELELLTEKVSRQKFTDCLKAVGNQNFCQCLREKSPVGTDFAGYVKIVTTNKDELGYSSADKETKGLIDNTLKAREECVTT